MADAEYNFRQCSFLSEFHNLQTVLAPKNPLYTDQISISITSIYTGFK